jgi:hypothetical protein
MVTAEDVSQIENKKICYDELLQQIKKEHQAKAKEIIPLLCYALQNEDPFLSSEDIRDRIKKDLIDIWSKTTIQDNIPDEFKNEAKKSAKEKADQKRKNVIEECVTGPSQMVPEQSSSSNTAVFESKYEYDPPQVADTILKEEDNEILRLRQELGHQKQKQDVETNPTIDTELKLSYNEPIQEAQQEKIDQEKEELKKEVNGLKKHVQQLEQELSVLKGLSGKGLGHQKIRIPANELTKVLINRAMKMGAKYFELIVENGIAKLPRTKV